MRPEMHRYRQFWSQLGVVEGIVCQRYQPDVLHSDQGRNFESTILWQTLETFDAHSSLSPTGGWYGGTYEQIIATDASLFC